jgi:hypothetical protein
MYPHPLSSNSTAVPFYISPINTILRKNVLIDNKKSVISLSGPWNSSKWLLGSDDNSGAFTVLDSSIHTLSGEIDTLIDPGSHRYYKVRSKTYAP